ncbi:hypothetical protein [Bacillus sp. EB01]|uniref:hypothetical protein n=1 Tax=Bacillus sp. EB01 TaxID=1347086 RepID=UPI0005C5506A|nr:hypothetical protein [Bacillus sp. EB01]
MRNVRYLINDEFEAEEIAEALRLQLDVNRYRDVQITAVDRRNELIVQVPEANDGLEEALGSFMAGYQHGVILE